mgnify:CR=1 FL=1
MTDHTMEEKRNHAVLVGLHASSLSQEENASDATLEELEALLETAGGVCVGSVLQNRETPEARTFIGEGKVAEVAALVQAQGADLVVFDPGKCYKIDRETFVSKGKNTPFHGREVWGEVRYTLVDGQVVYEKN